MVLGDTPPLEPAETFYQRALEGHALDLAPGALEQIAATSRSDYYDRVALRGLALAQRDLASDALAFERLEEIHAQITTLLGQLDDFGPATVRATPSAPDAWQAGGAVVCIPGRGQLDDLAATMAAQVLMSAGFGVTVEPNRVLGSSGPADRDLSDARLCCLSVLQEGSTASGIRYFVRRMQKKMPSANVVVCLWQAPADSPLLADLRSTGEDEHLVLSIGELTALAQPLSARRPMGMLPGSDR